MAENRGRPSGYETKVDLSEAQRKGGVQVVQTNGLPEGYVPPSASLTPPPTPPPPSSGDAGAGGGSGQNDQ